MRITCSRWIRPSPKGMPSPDRWEDLRPLDKNTKFALHGGYADRLNYMCREFYEGKHTEWTSACILYPHLISDVLVGPGGGVCSPGRTASPSLIYHPLWWSKPVLDLEKAVNLRQYNDGAYFHFVAEVLPRLACWSITS